MKIQNTTDLPHGIADRFTQPVARFLKIESAAGGLLLIAVLLALFLANSRWESAFLAFWETPVGLTFGPLDFIRSLRDWINDGLMTFFFFVISLELKRELVLGELRKPKIAALPLAAALGGMIVPVTIYLALIVPQPGTHGWGTVMATDTAFAIGCLALFGQRVPTVLRLFLLSLAIFDDVGAILVVAVFYGEPVNWAATGFAILGLSLVSGLARLGIRSIPIYYLFGIAIWLCIDASGIHATIAGVLLGLMTPTNIWVNDSRLRTILGRVLAYPVGEHWSGDTPERHDLREAGRAVAESLSPVERIELTLHPWVGFVVMPVFALANAGVVIDLNDIAQPISIAIVVGLVLGKPLGVLGFSWGAVRLGLAVRHPDLTWPSVAAGAFLAGIGFTMSLFIANLAFDRQMLGAAKLGILTGSAISAILGLLTLVSLTILSERLRRKNSEI
ncbi:Na+/H+ antiporter NhaA [Roseibium sediminis]|uniref:Na+/H+ antiporter NhaA n=1 Tax=Roseibium sediminis TaxID=1775174 RepID=UPI00123DB368|nr:Na+/H+ antiporter NhaA [Roseibium sediminis]